jgi:hypothetical protein
VTLLDVTKLQLDLVGLYLISSQRIANSNIMAAAKRKISEENRRFNDDWTDEFLMIGNGGKGMMCLICNDVLKTLKRVNAKSHYASKHAGTYDQMAPELRRERVAALLQQRRRQQTMMRGPVESNEKTMLASYRITHLMMKRGNS